jgi:hypothetical protein
MDTEKQYIIYHFIKVGQIINKKQLNTTNFFHLTNICQVEKYLYTKRKNLTKISVLSGQLIKSMVTSNCAPCDGQGHK